MILAAVTPGGLIGWTFALGLCAVIVGIVIGVVITIIKSALSND